MKQTEAAEALGMNVSSVIRACRVLGIEKWGYSRPAPSATMNSGQKAAPHLRAPSQDDAAAEEPPCSVKVKGVSLNKELLLSMFHMKQTEATEALGMKVSSVIRACRVLGIEKWGYSRRKSCVR